MHLCDGVIDHVRARFEEIVDRTTNGLFVSWDRRGGDDDGVPVLNLNVAMFAVCHFGEACHRLALSASGGDDKRLLRAPCDLLLGEERGRELQIAQVASDFDVLLHGATDDGNLAVELTCCVEHLLNARNVRGEGRNDDSARCAADDPLERLANNLLARCVAWSLGARAVRDQCQYALCAKLCQHGEIRRLSIGWSLVKLEVAGVNHRSDW